MSDSQRRLLRFAYVGLVERLCRIRSVIRRAETDAPDFELNHPLFTKLYKRVDTRLEDLTAGGMPKVLALESLDHEAVRSIHEVTMNALGEIPALHELAVRWLSGPWASPHIARAVLLALEERFGPATAARVRRLSPIVAQVGFYDFLGDLSWSSVSATMSESIDGDTAIVAWATPAAELDNPLAWPMLFHEVAHTIIRIHPTVQQAMTQVTLPARSPTATLLLEQYITEHLADRVAAAISGPSFFLALSNFALLSRQSDLFHDFSGGPGRSPRPSELRRVNAVRLFLEEECELPLTRRGSADMSASRWIDGLMGTRRELDSLSERPHLSERERPGWLPAEAVVNEIVKSAYDTLAERFGGWSPYSLVEQTRSDELSRSLARDNPRPIAASPTKAKEFGTDTIKELREDPNTAVSILNAGWCAEASYWHPLKEKALIEDFPSQEPLKGIEEFTEIIDMQDALISKSLETMLVHRDLLKARDSHANG